MAIVEVKVLPVGTQDPSISSYIRECYLVAEQNDAVDIVVTPTSTILEGDLETLLPIVESMHESPFSRGIARVVTTITIDERRDKEEDMDDMVNAVYEPMEIHD
ncbi:MAG: hypothetical protein C7B46_08790 [Sulfobacillus benefaciens]|uniref:Thiamine-binding protein domain-containing protein n=1 Tax=Sulfobacillus benefaciens TaxID=453960 RepID=A0A2T2XGX5_9FIRM|nr:MAG: hypothetical protein C7B46_08790 [Sulfobacillus benefaciens]